MVLLASAALAMPAAAAQQHQGQTPRSQQYQQQGRSVHGGAWNNQQSYPMRSRIKAQNLSSEQIRKIQRALKESGSRSLAVDGQWGPSTRKALRSFQQQKGMAATGRLDRRVIGALGLNPQRFATGESRPTSGRSVSPGGRRYRGQGGRSASPQWQ
jgi:peptidoglycan hydrolase-like protein with peptidoglycan-binding domain